MAEFQDIVGAILKEIAQARIASDLYAREVSQEYQKDQLLRLFPVPRTEIKDIAIDMRFAITEVDTQQRTQNRNLQVYSIISNYANLLATEAVPYLAKSFDAKNFEEGSKITQKDLQAYIHQALLLKKDTYLNAQGVYDLTIAKEVLQEGLNKYMGTILTLISVDFNTKLENVVEGNLNITLEAMGNALNETFANTSSQVLNIEVAENNLANMPANMLSSVKITSEVRNYVWTDIEDEEGNKTKRLIPE